MKNLFDRLFKRELKYLNVNSVEIVHESNEMNDDNRKLSSKKELLDNLMNANSESGVKSEEMLMQNESLSSAEKKSLSLDLSNDYSCPYCGSGNIVGGICAQCGS